MGPFQDLEAIVDAMEEEAQRRAQEQATALLHAADAKVGGRCVGLFCVHVCVLIYLVGVWACGCGR